MPKKPNSPSSSLHLTSWGIISFLFACYLLSSSTSSGRANGAGAGSTGAPCDNSLTCGNLLCHSDNSFGQTTEILDLIDPLSDTITNRYIPGKSYRVRVQVISGPGTGRFGFQATAIDSQLVDAGKWFDPGSNVQIATAPDCMGRTRTYAEHESPHFLSTFISHWQAPECDIGPITFYFAGNKVNNNQSPTGDSGGLGDSMVYHAADVSHLVLDQNPITAGHYWARYDIETSGTIVFPDSVSLLTGDSLCFLPNFHIQQGAAMTVNLNDCD